MQTLLIVEDEKMIRQGIKTMALRSGVPIGQVLECSNGIDALKLLEQLHVDVMFTDIRMQKMDGIELVRRVGELEDKPLIVAISGYDDFNYAVEMLRNGVKEYLLKPVERERIAEILKKLDDELEQKNNEHNKEKEQGLRQIRSLLTKDELSDDEKKFIINQYKSFFFDEEYVVCVYRDEAVLGDYEGIVFDKLSEGAAIAVPKKHAKEFLENEMADKCAGVSNAHSGLEELQIAYTEALSMRELSFVSGKICVYGENKPERVFEDLREKAKELLTEQSRTSRIQIIGTDKTDEVINRWKGLFKILENGQITLTEFSYEIKENLKQIKEIYSTNMSDEERDMIERLRDVNLFENLSDYQVAFMDWVIGLNRKLASREDESTIKQKIILAQKYIRENYNRDFNMAVVSNYVSMNYSLFSYSFKQYTGRNFVNYLKEIRIEKAKNLLAETDLKIIEISQKVGYENEKHFMKTFKALCGVSPGEYRKNMANC